LHRESIRFVVIDNGNHFPRDLSGHPGTASGRSPQNAIIDSDRMADMYV
jgi:hypothetical protein